ncbi:MFS transporter [Brachybacterium vulturis]|uniref:MFS transporter n=1 Tax=Brachybacterium vulturis TaxID=2017484 RepID=A0A291GMJ2_9MICO|nr:MDR family MFS transporter [Brachybacterium vulturis]ATG51418.1 MFS transporter [Brachybacterium vulturis]
MGHTDDETPEASGRTQPAVNPILVMAVLLAGAFVIILNQTLLNTALPAFMVDFGISANTAQWVTTLFMLVNGIMIPATAFLIQKFTTRTMFFAAMGIFTLGTIICAIAPIYPVLLLGRVVQAAAGGMIMPLMQTILFAIFPIHKRGTAMGTFGLVISFAPAIGPTLSGFIVDNWSWRWLFVMMLPIAVGALIFAHLTLKNVTEQTNPHLDTLSLILSTFAFGGLLFGFSNAGNVGWGSLQVIIPLIVGVLTLVWFVHRQLRLEEPLLELRVLANRMFALGTVLGMLVFMAMVGGMLMIPLYMQNMSDFSAMESGLVLLPGAVIMGVMSPVTGRIFDRFGASALAIIGFALLAVTSFLLAQLSVDTTFTYIAVVNAVRMLGTAMVMMPVTTAALNQLPQRMIPHGTAVNNTMRQVAASVGTGVLVTVMTAAARDPEVYGMAGPIHGVNVAFIVAGGIAVLGLIGSFFLRGSRPQQPESVPLPEE